MARKYGIVPASDVKIGAERGANFQAGSIHLPRKPFRPIMSPSPGMTTAGHPFIDALNARLVKKGTDKRDTKDTKEAAPDNQTPGQSERGVAMAQHPAARTQGDVASRTGGNAPGAVPGANTAQSANAYYQAPKNMGAKVPASRAAKFTQGRGL